MCGIYCHIGITGTLNNIVMVSHRGPDNFSAESFYSGKFLIEFAHWRLSIIDLSDSSNQPLKYEDGRFTIIYNGEIYNYLELREELKKRGKNFKTNSDTEVLVAAYSEYGTSFLSKLRGMFSFIIFDAKKDTIFAARDRFGIKPLYYFNSYKGLTFASEIKQFISLPEFRAQINDERVFDFLAFGYLDHTDETLFKKIRQVRGGEYLKLDLNQFEAGKDLTLVKWYELEKKEIPTSEDEIISEFGRIFDETLRIHLRSDVPVGSCLSGGMDSSAIVCRINEFIEKKGNLSQHVFTNCVRNIFDERVYVEEIVKNKKLMPYYAYLDFEQIDEKWNDSIYAQDEPFNNMSIIAQGNLFRLSRENNVIVLLDGQGADELLGSYDMFLFFELFRLIRKLQFRKAGRVLKNNTGLNLLSGAKSILNIISPVAANHLRDYYAGRKDESIFNPEGWKRKITGGNKVFKEINDTDGLSRSMLKFSPIPMLLHWEDRSSMINSVESRVPFLDHELAEFIYSVPDEIKFKNGIRKYPLKSAMKNSVPEKIRKRNDKIGFETEETEFMRSPSMKDSFERIYRSDSLTGELINLKLVNDRFSQFCVGSNRYDPVFWRILSFDKWCGRFNLNL